ncbi:hypothetical protein FGO68_gene2584 [Halteria grandinella]|uniref:Uncharacterized protein n=1 Tax=Halteria grandinella TaxID=5974 RepID=A0A8J8NVZ4_HALGN|nr:hypothetical protein FGO68_gene2584 [Halteria grandinella]
MKKDSKMFHDHQKEHLAVVGQFADNKFLGLPDSKPKHQNTQNGEKNNGGASPRNGASSNQQIPHQALKTAHRESTKQKRGAGNGPDEKANNRGHGGSGKRGKGGLDSSSDEDHPLPSLPMPVPPPVDQQKLKEHLNAIKNKTGKEHSKNPEPAGSQRDKSPNHREEKDNLKVRPLAEHQPCSSSPKSRQVNKLQMALPGNHFASNDQVLIGLGQGGGGIHGNKINAGADTSKHQFKGAHHQDISSSSNRQLDFLGCGGIPTNPSHVHRESTKRAPNQQQQLLPIGHGEPRKQPTSVSSPRHTSRQDSKHQTIDVQPPSNPNSRRHTYANPNQKQLQDLKPSPSGHQPKGRQDSRNQVMQNAATPTEKGGAISMDYHLAKLSGGLAGKGGETQKHADNNANLFLNPQRDSRSRQSNKEVKEIAKADILPSNDATFHGREDTEIHIPEETKCLYESQRGIVIDDSTPNLKNLGQLSNVFDNMAMSQPNCLKIGYSHINNTCFPPAATIDLPKLYSQKHTNMSKLNVPRKSREFLPSQ